MCDLILIENHYSKEQKYTIIQVSMNSLETVDKKLPISETKFKDLMTLCKSGITHGKYHNKYTDMLQTTKNTRHSE